MNTRRTSQGGFTLIEVMVVIVIIGVLSAVVLSATSSSRVKSRDANRISEVRQIQYALAIYYATNGNYPPCLYTPDCGTPLDAATPVVMKSVPKDPLTGAKFTYSAFPVACSTYHLGVSLEDKSNRALLVGADTPAYVGTLCSGSAADFDGLSYAPGGQQCNATTGGVPQPTGAANGETCYDVKP